jgi:hypothetical protein
MMSQPPGQPPYGQPYHQPYHQPYGQPPGPYPPPPPLPYSQQPQPRPPQQSRKVLFIALGVAAAVVVVLVIVGVVALLAFVGRDSVTATDIEVGDCLSEIPGDARVFSVRTVSCEEPHVGEVFAVLQMPDGDYPGQATINDYADQCGPRLSAFAPSAMTDDSVQLYVLYPTPETWKLGDRAVTCIATLDPPRTGSLKGYR